MTRLQDPAPVSHRRFDRSDANRDTLVAFASDIASLKECVENGCPWVAPLRDGKPGMWIQGHNDTIQFRLTGIQRDGEGDLQYWTYEVCEDHLERAKGIRFAVIYND